MTIKLKNAVFITAQYLLPHHLLSRFVGIFAESEWPIVKHTLMNFFLKRFGIDMSEAEREDIQDYRNFNDFFTRALKPGVRTIQGNEETWVSPVDACISQFGAIEDGQLIQAKGKNFTLTDLLGGDASSAAHYKDGEFITLYLSPKDYHRIHMPLAAKLVKTTFIPGKLFSVNPLTANTVSRLFARNERLVCEFDSEQGRFVMVLVGAMVVASIETTWSGVVAPFQRKIVQHSLNSKLLDFEKGEEMGRFKLGSTVIMAFENDKMRWNSQIKNNANIKLGEPLN
jgi:phosphatidylserine decarboxylase